MVLTVGYTSLGSAGSTPQYERSSKQQLQNDNHMKHTIHNKK